MVNRVESDPRGNMKPLHPQPQQSAQTQKLPVTVIETGTESCAGDRQGVLVKV